MEKVTIATSSGVLWLGLVSHFGSALIALVAGTIALVVAKGGKLHKKSGMVFTIAMGVTGVLIVPIAAYEGNIGSVVGGILIIYFVYTAMTAVKPMPWSGGAVDVALMTLAFAIAAISYWYGFVAWSRPRHVLNGVPAAMRLFLATICLLAAIGDLRTIRAGGLRGPRRLARHLWRMCFALFIATGSFFIGQMKFVPAPIRIMPLLIALGVAPLFVLLYWMWRVRLRRRLGGLIIASPRLTSDSRLDVS
ncbi:MAG TPA: hypothetical protein VJ865_06900 [Gemmatimonadaceae bacterium]|nr:hypothetical protein [Gemmatimonadaceae bacterium]